MKLGILVKTPTNIGKIHKDGKYSQVKWGETRSDQAATVSIFTERCGSNLVLVTAYRISE